jgi:hypothetical protein
MDHYDKNIGHPKDQMNIGKNCEVWPIKNLYLKMLKMANCKVTLQFETNFFAVMKMRLGEMR